MPNTASLDTTYDALTRGSVIFTQTAKPGLIIVFHQQPSQENTLEIYAKDERSKTYDCAIHNAAIESGFVGSTVFDAQGYEYHKLADAMWQYDVPAVYLHINTNGFDMAKFARHVAKGVVE
jgi:hypothetical protein